MKIVNLTKHDVNVRTDSGIKTFAPSGTNCRANLYKKEIDEIDGVKIIREIPSEVINFPNEPDTLYIVSGIVFSALKEQGYNNIVRPNIKEAIKDNGIIYEVPNLIMV